MNHTAAIVTGGNRGVGEGICYALASKGYDIFMAHCGEADKATHVAQQLREKFGVRVVTFDCDQRERTIGETLMTQALLAFSSISLVMCNAGVGLEKYMRLIHPEEIDYVYEVNFRGACSLQMLQPSTWWIEVSAVRFCSHLPSGLKHPHRWMPYTEG